MSEGSIDDIKYQFKKWFNKANYNHFDNINNSDNINNYEALYQYEFRAALYDFYEKGNSDYKKIVINSKYFKKIISGEVHSLTSESIKQSVFEMRQVSAGKGNSVREKEIVLNNMLGGANHKFKTISPLKWATVEELYKSSKSPFLSENSKKKSQDQLDYIEHVGSYPDLNIKNGMLTVSIRLECDEELVVRELKRLLSIWRREQEGVSLNGGSLDLKRLSDKRLLMLCDLLLWCKVNDYPEPQYPLIKELIFNKTDSESNIKQNYLKRARRLLNWAHIYHLRSK